ncbi:UDP-N-acetylglucosamine 4,6-dehydratase (inverting) [Terasakiella sp. SH-1]|uniref:UDP-N-acetylglucosamine 4,6-dehydratase (inverting) n=1 Tax=Terasakiella sp. SH-1 TaxID=2560057 RepID=UPI0010739788|nr:UDP-N-acetylglucosamine 4,6-dehydratase (inverting) [Terasakiella sp. SH-1]
MRSFSGDFALFNHKSILVTGGTGSFGKAFVSEVLDKADPRRLIVFSRDELKQYEMQEMFASHDKVSTLRFFIGDVRDEKRLTMAFRDVDFVIHAAALKQVPAAEYNPTECIQTNIIGAENIVHAAIACNVEKVVALSTDKAVNPVNLYGATKLASDKVFVAANNLAGREGTRFSIVRYGNVVGSRGSVVPLFQKLLAEGAQKIPLTDPDMTRFWITLNQGVDLVVRAFNDMRGGEVFIPKIPSMKMSDMATALVPGVEQEVIGVRPGEKMHEIMISPDDARNTIELEDYYIIKSSFAYWGQGEQGYENAKPVEKGFQYSSDLNTEWLDKESLLRMLSSA